MIETRRLLVQTAPIVEGEDGDCKDLYPSKTHIKFYDYFIGIKYLIGLVKMDLAAP